MNPALLQEIQTLVRQGEQLPSGQRTAFYLVGAARLGLSRATFYRKLKEISVSKPRKRRADAGTTAITLDELRLVSALLVESIRANNKKLSSVKLAVERLRSNGLIVAGRVDEQTGELRYLSTSAISKALFQHNLHPEQVLAPAPAVSLASKHPNHVWQIDASISTQFYLDDDGARALDRTQYYDGKPGNLRKIERKRLWRYVITDHTSGTIYVQYVLGAESAENLCDVLIQAMQKRGGQDPFHGVPLMIMTDPGAAMTSAMFRNLCKALSIELIINQVGNARAKGQVEQAHNIVECDFESGLKLAKAETLEQINALAGQWMRYYNATAIHSRHRRTRYGVWQLIKPEQLRLAPPVAVCRELAISAPELRKVSPLLRVQFRGAEFDVSTVPGVMVHEKLLITRNPWRDEESAQVVLVGEDGREQFHVVERIEQDQFGFADTSVTVGEGHKRHARTPAQVARELLEQIATGTDSVEAAAAARKAKVQPFNGAIDPNKHITDTTLPAYLPKRGEALEPSVDVGAGALAKPMSHVAAAKLLRPQVSSWSSESLAWLKENYPDGVPEDQLDAIATELNRPARPGLRVVGGNS